MSAPKHRAAQPRHILAEQATDLRAQGLNGVQIAERLQISRSYAYELLSDPNGTANRGRKQKYYGTCDSCGGPTAYRVGGASRVCNGCIVWTREAVLEALRDWFDEHGLPPRCDDARPSDGGHGLLPYCQTVARLFGSWNAALLAADLPLVCDRRSTTQAAIEAALRAGERTADIADRFGVTQQAIYQRCRVRGTTISAMRRAAA